MSSVSDMGRPETAQQPVAIIGAGLDLGAGRRGVDMGPSAIRYAGLDERIRAVGHAVADWGDVRTAVPEATAMGDASARYLEEILATCDRTADLVAKAAGGGQVPLVLGGDHSIAIGSLAGMARARGKGGALWIDAHGDLNTPATSPTGNVHGMPLAAALGAAGEGFPDASLERAALIGVRSLDPGERALVQELDVKVFTMSDLDKHGVQRVLDEALTFLASSRFVHVSLDLDAVDPQVAPGVGTPVRGGLSYREAHFVLELVAESGLLDSLDVVEVNPILDRENETAQLAVELVASALGARIL
jgi:arginase